MSKLMIEETKIMKRILPDRYTCEPREDGVHCYSETGIDDNDEELWKYTFLAIKQAFGSRFMEVFHQTCYNHKKFTVFLKEENNE